MENMIRVKIKTVKQISEEWRDLGAYTVNVPVNADNVAAEKAAQEFVNMLSIASITTPIRECRWNWSGSPQGHYFAPVYR